MNWNGVMETSSTYRLAGADGPRDVRQNGKPLCQPSVGAATSGSPTPGTLQTMEKLSPVTPLSQQVCFLGPYYCGVVEHWKVRTYCTALSGTFTTFLSVPPLIRFNAREDF